MSKKIDITKLSDKEAEKILKRRERQKAYYNRKHFRLTNKNYFSPEAEKRYMGTTQFKNFMKCEAAALATINGEYKRKKTTALLVGSYVDAYFEGTLDDFKVENPDIFTRNGTLKADFIKAEEIIARIERDEMFMRYMSGGKQAIKTGEIAGVPFKIKIDSLHDAVAIVDMKIMKDFEPMYKPGEGKLTFIEFWGYDLQGGIYQEVEGNKLPFYIAAATKEDEPDIGVFFVPQEYLDVALDKVKELAPRYQAIKNGEIEPVRCERCDYCKRTKVLTKIISLEDLKDE
ncbi:MAG: PD-(D/E)XK nuclease-like domain-containing protein [Clostridia bacterium]|nr:PD-(D/E)XK nuclease-like domain-containing protein [Clostridia bacterium]